MNQPSRYPDSFDLTHRFNRPTRLATATERHTLGSPINPPSAVSCRLREWADETIELLSLIDQPAFYAEQEVLT